MKIALIASAKSIHIIKIANSMGELGHCIAIFSLPEHIDKSIVYNSNVKIIRLNTGGSKGYFTNTKQLKNEIAKFSPDIVNAHYASGYGTLVRLSKIRPYLLSVWGSDIFDFPYKNFISKRIVKSNLRGSACVLATGTALRDQVTNLGIKNKCELTPFGVDLTKFYKADNQHTKIKIGIVKALEHVYGIDILITSIDLLKKMRPNLELTVDIYGDGSLKETIQEQINILNLQGIIKLCGKIPHERVPDVLNEFDIFVAPSRKESFGVAVLEAMACGVVCVTSSAKGFCEIGVDNETLLMFNDEDAEQLAKKILLCIEDGNLKNKLINNSLKKINEQYNWKYNIIEIESVYKKYSKQI